MTKGGGVTQELRLRHNGPTVADICTKLGYDPLKELIELIPFLSKEAQAKIALDVMAYIYSKPKIEIDTGGQAPQSNPLREKPASELIAALPNTNDRTAPGTR